MTSVKRVWFITGVSSGFGQALVNELMAIGEVPVGTFRQPEQVAAFNRDSAGKALGVLMDVTRPEQVVAGVQQALDRFGRIDVLVNNAGYGFMGAVEEASPDEIRAAMETNFFGAVNVTQTVLPTMRRQRSGHILQISSASGIRCAVPKLGIYSASKFALEGLSEALALELAPLGIRMTIVEPGPFRTAAMSSSRNAARTIDDYSGGHAGRRDASQVKWGDPRKGVRVMIQCVNAETPPLRLPLDLTAVEYLRIKARSLLGDADAGEEAAASTGGSVVAR